MKKKKLFVIGEAVAKQYIIDCLAHRDKKALTAFCNRLIDDGSDAGQVCQLVLSCKMALSTNNVKQ